LPVTSATVEGLSEAETAFTQNIIAIASGEDKEKEVMDGVPDAFLVGAGQGSLMGLAMGKKSAPVDGSIGEMVSKYQKSLDDINKDLQNPNLPDATRDVLNTVAQDLKNKIDEANRQDDEMTENLSLADYNKVVGYRNEVEEMKASLSEISSPELKDAVLLKIEEVENKINEVINPKEVVESGASNIQEPVVAEEEKVDVKGVGDVAGDGQIAGQKAGQKDGEEVERRESIRNQARGEISKVLDDDTLTEQQEEEKTSQIVSAAKIQMNIKESDLKQPNVKFEMPTLTVEVSKPFVETLNILGYSDADIANMTIDQQWNIVDNKIQAPEVVSSAKVDSVKENKRQERIAEMQRELDAEVADEAQKPVVAEGVEEIPDSGEAKIEAEKGQEGSLSEISKPTPVAESSEKEGENQEASQIKNEESEITFEGKRGRADSITFDGKKIKQDEEIELTDVNISQDDSMPDLRSGKYKVRMLSVDANGKTATLTLTDGNEVITTTVNDLRKAASERFSVISSS